MRPCACALSRLRASQLGLLVLLLLSTRNAALALRWPSWGRLQLRRSPSTAEAILREVLSPKTTIYPVIASGHTTPADPADSLAALDIDQEASSEALSTSLWDPALATVFSIDAVRRLPRLASGPRIVLPPLEPAQPSIMEPRGTESGSAAAEEQHAGLDGDGSAAAGAGAAGVHAADPPPPEFDTAEATMAGRLASIAYCSHPDLLQAWNCTRCRDVPGFVTHRVVYDSLWDLAAYVGYYPPWDAIVLAFRGTDSSNWGQWAENMRAWRTDHMYPVPNFPHALIHAGFYTLWTGSSLQATFTEAISELFRAHPTARLVATGHSMGAALAQLAALEVKLEYNTTRTTHTTVYTFGSPRVGNLAYQQLFNSFIDVSWRLTHNRDIVPSVPLQLMGFQHVAREVWEVDVENPEAAGGVERVLLLCDASGEDPSCHNSACYLGLCTSVADHLAYLGLHMYQDGDEC